MPRSIVGQGICHECGQQVNSRFPRSCPGGGTCMPHEGLVRPGSLWLTSKGYRVMVTAPITDTTFSIIMWPDGEEMKDGNAKASMLNADALLLDAEHLADPLPSLVTMIRETYTRARAQARANFQSRQSRRGVS
jgi:hypothetical protein